MSIVLKHISYIHPDREQLFTDINLIINKGEKSALIGKNGSGKSTLLRIISRQIQLTTGEIITESSPYYVPQHFGQYNELTIAQALHIDEKLTALHHILEGDTSTHWFEQLNDDWTIEDRAREALQFWEMDQFPLDYPLHTLSGGEKTKIFLAGIHIHEPEIILLDEPTNHLDMDSRQKLYELIRTRRSTFLIVSHDIHLLNLLTRMIEIDKKGIINYGGNYDFYKTEKEIQQAALTETLEEKEKALRQARKAARETAERKNKLDARGKKLSEKKGIARIAMNTLRDKAEKSTSRLKDVHQDKIGELEESVKQLYKEVQDNNLLKVAFNSSSLHYGKILVKADQVNIKYGESFLWKENKSFELRSGERILIKGKNGTGKTTLLKMITGDISPGNGIIEVSLTTCTDGKKGFLYIDQEYSLIVPGLTVYEQLEKFNNRHMQEHELKTLLARFLFPYSTWSKKCNNLSGGEKMRLMFCCLLASNDTPDMILLDEPTNNLDTESIEVIISAIQEYKGTVLLVSHDVHFIREIGIERTIEI